MTMPKRSRRRRILKWTGVWVCVLILIVWTASLQRYFEYVPPQWPPRASIELYDGCILVRVWTTDFAKDVPFRLQFYRKGSYSHYAVSRRYGFRLPTSMTSQRRGYTRIVFPLWMPLVVASVPTAFLFWRDRRRIPPGHCQRCGYNLTGNVSGKCSECGESCKRDASAT